MTPTDLLARQRDIEQHATTAARDAIARNDRALLFDVVEAAEALLNVPVGWGADDEDEDERARAEARLDAALEALFAAWEAES